MIRIASLLICAFVIAQSPAHALSQTTCAAIEPGMTGDCLVNGYTTMDLNTGLVDTTVCNIASGVRSCNFGWVTTAWDGVVHKVSCTGKTGCYVDGYVSRIEPHQLEYTTSCLAVNRFSSCLHHGWKTVHRRPKAITTAVCKSQSCESVGWTTLSETGSIVSQTTCIDGDCFKVGYIND